MSWSIQMETASQLPAANILEELQANTHIVITALSYDGINLLDGKHEEAVSKVRDALVKYQDFRVSEDALCLAGVADGHGGSVGNGLNADKDNSIGNDARECVLQYQRFDSSYDRTRTAKAGELLRFSTEVFRVYYDNVAIANAAVYEAWMSAARDADGYYVGDDIMLRGLDEPDFEEKGKEAKVVFTVNGGADWKERVAGQGRFLSLYTWEGAVRGKA